MKNFKKIFNIVILVLTAPFNILLKSNAISNPNKQVKPLVVLGISVVIVAVVIFIYYYAGEVFKW
jgi:hypothetical protein